MDGALRNILQAVVDNGDIWIADIRSGLVRGENMTVFSALTLPGPVSNNAFNITSLNGKTIICGGATTSRGIIRTCQWRFQYLKIITGLLLLQQQ